MSSSAKQSLIHKPDQDGENYVRGDLEAQRLGSFRRSSGSSSSDRRYFSFFAITCFATNCKILWAKDKYFSPGSKGGVSGSSVSLTTPQVRNTSVDDHRQRELICIFWQEADNCWLDPSVEQPGGQSCHLLGDQGGQVLGDQGGNLLGDHNLISNTLQATPLHARPLQR